MDADDILEDVSPADRTHELIGDGSQPYALPTIKSKHDRFKRIDATTMVRLIDGDFRDIIESFTVIDCRYPYEYHGGHIINSINIHQGNELIKLFIEKKTDISLSSSTVTTTSSESSSSTSTFTSSSSSSSSTSTSNHHKNHQQQQHQSSRHIIIFHCEFSSERGPRLMRFLREKDRQINKYPELLHPELYLLEGGYKDFYKKYKEYCVPQAYKPMKSRNHRDELRDYRKRKRTHTQPRRRKENRTPDISFEGS